jgi:hypothetical protein
MSRRPGLALLLFLGAAPAHASPPPTFGAEVDVDRPVLVSAVGDQTVAAAAYDGEQFLAAWRSSLWKPELRVGRVTLAGEVLDPRGLLLDGFERIEGRVGVASGAGAFLVVWGNEPGRIRAARVAVEGGKLVASPAVNLTEQPVTTSMIGPVVVWSGAGYWVLWGQLGDGAGVYALQVSPAGQALGTPRKLADAAAEPALVWDGTQVLAGWAAPGPSGVEVELVRLRADGSADLPAVSALTVPGEKAGPLSLAWNGGQYLVTAAGIDAAGAQKLRAARVSPQLGVLDVGGFDVAAPAGTAAGGPTALGTGTGFTVLWASATMEGNRNVPRLGGSQIVDGKPAALPAFPWSQAGQMPFLTAAGADPFVFWSEAGWWTDEGLLVDLDVQAGPLGGGRAPALVSRGVNGQTQPVVALGGDQLFVAWEDRRGDRQHGDVYAARLAAADGSTLDPQGLPLGVGAGAQTAPAVAWDGANFVAAWHDGRRGLAMSRVNPKGEILDRPPIVVPGTVDQPLLGEPVLCGDGDGALLVWSARAPGAAGAQIRGLRLVRGETAAGPGTVLVETADTEQPPVVRLGCNQQGAIVVWSGSRVPKDKVPLSMLHLARGRLTPTSEPVILQPSEGDEWAGIGSDGSNFLVVWRNFDGQGRRNVVGQRVSAEGSLIEDRPFRIGLSNSGQRVTALWDGAQYLVFAINTAGGNPFELRGRRVGPHGEALDADWIPVNYLAQPWAGTGNGSDGVFLRPGHTFLVYDRYYDDDATGNIRIRGRFIESTPPDMPDAGPPDASPDAGLADAAPAPAPALSKGSGCSCQQASGRPPVVLVFVLVLVLGRLLHRSRDPLRHLDDPDHR